MQENHSFREYRPDVDGLRALAVMCVILFHVDIAAFSGGFVGVDVFFVISGYLITGNIVALAKSNNWSFATFYLRRWRRLFPAYLFTIILSFVFAFLLFSPEQLSRFGHSVLYSMIYGSNFFFWFEAGYFDVSADTKPLLHLWSLAVEEQFYLFWPVAIVLLLRFRGPLVLPLAMLFMGIASLLAAEWFLTTDPSAAFFLFPFRIYQFAIGGLLVFANFHLRLPNALAELCMAVGLGLIAYAVFTFSEQTVYPGWRALIPSLGAALLILFGKATYLGLLLRNPVSVGIGLISYSAYLVHWPLIVFYKSWSFAPLSGVAQITLVLVSLLLAGVMYRLVESPLRMAGGTGRKRTTWLFLGASLASLAIVAIPAAHAWKNEGWPWRVEVVAVSIPKELRSRKLGCPKGWSTTCQLVGEPDESLDVLVLGDSHSRAMWPAFHHLGRKHGWTVVGRKSPGCFPLFGTHSLYDDNVMLKSLCATAVTTWETIIEESKPDYVVLAGRWALLTSPEIGPGLIKQPQAWLLDRENPQQTFAESRALFDVSLERTVARINALGARVVLVSQAPSLGIDPAACRSTPRYLYPGASDPRSRCQYIPYEQLVERLRYSEKIIQDVAERHDALVINLRKVLCDDSTRTCKTFLDDVLLYQDDNHLNHQGSLYTAHAMEDELLRYFDGSSEEAR